MRRGWWWLLLAGLSLVQAETLTDRTGVIVRPNEYSFSGACATGQIGMNGGSGKTYRCVSGRWEREDLPACAATDTAGNTCTKRSVCLNRTEGSILVCNANNLWQTIVGGDGGSGTGEYNYSQVFTDSTSVNLTHSLGTPNVLVSCYDSSDVQISPDTIDIAAADPWDITVTFEVTQTGRCVVNGSGNGTTGGGGSPGGYPDLREDGAARVNDAEFIDFRSGLDVSTTGQVSLDYTEDPVNLSSSEVTGTLAIARGGTGSTAFTANTCIRYNGTSLVSAATDCGSGGGGVGCTDIDNDCLADNAENVTCTGCINLQSPNIEVNGLLSALYGGTGIPAPNAHWALIGGNSSNWTQIGIPDCDGDSSTLGYDRNTFAFVCNTDDSSGTPSTPEGPEGALQFYEGGNLGSNAYLVWQESTDILHTAGLQVDNLIQGDYDQIEFDADRNGTTDVKIYADDAPLTSHYIGFANTGDYIRWMGTPLFNLIWRNGYMLYDFAPDLNPASADFCLRENGIDADCDGVPDFNPNPANWNTLIGNSTGEYANAVIPDCDGSGQALNFSQAGSAGTFSCQNISAGSSGLANKLDVGLDGTNVQVEVDGTTVDMDPDGDGSLEARINADGSIETFGATNESGGLGSNGKLIFSADDNIDGTGVGMDWDFDGDGTYELSAAGTGTLTMLTGAVIPGVCASTTPAATITANDCNVLPLGAGSVGVTTINTCNATNLGRVLYVLCGSATTTLDDTGGNLQLGGDRLCAANRVLTLVCDGTNWLEVAWAAN